MITTQRLGDEESKLVKYLIVAAPSLTTVANHFSTISDVTFTLRDSEFHYEGEYLLGRGTDTRIILVPAQQLSRLPRRYRKAGMLYVLISCRLNDTRFDTFLDHELIPAIRYHV